MPDAGFPAPPPLTERLAQAAALREHGQHDAAAAAYRALLAEDASVWQALAGLAACALDRHDWAAAAGHLAAALALHPADRSLRLDYANALREQGQPDAAEPVYRTLVADFPGFWPALAGLGLSLRARGDLAGAAEQLGAAVRAGPEVAWPRLEYADTLRDLRHLDDADAAYRALLAGAPSLWQAEAGLGVSRRLRGDLDGAAEHLMAALRAAPDAAWVRLEYANTLREQRRFNTAEAAYRALLADHPSLWQPLAGLAACARERRDWAATAEHLAAALALTPGTRWLRLDYADALREQGRADAAEAAYRALLAEVPGFWPALAGLGLCLRARGDLAGAAEQFAAALGAGPDAAWPRLEYANTLRDLHRLDAAEAAYRAVLAQDASVWQALVGLGACARARRDWAATAAHLAAALALTPGDRWLRLDHADALREQGRVDAAETAYRALLAEVPGFWPALVGLGLCARLRGDRPAALAHLTAATEAAPGEDATWYELAGEQREQGRYDDARAALRPLFARPQPGLRAWLGLGHIERWAGDHAAALEAFRQGFAQHPQWSRFMIEIALEAQTLGQGAEAERWFQRAAEVADVAGEALTHLGNMARARQKMDTALALFRRAAAQPAAPVDAHTQLAQLLADLGEREAAMAALDAGTQRLGRRPELALARASLLRRAGQRAAALATAREAAAAMPAHQPLWFEWFENERLSGDAAALEACFAAAPAPTIHDLAMVHYARGQAAEQHWALDTAAREFRAALALNPGLSMAHEILARLCLLRFDIPAARQHLLAMRELRAADQRRQGRSPHLAHTHIGNFFDEFVMDAGLLRALADAQTLPAAQRAETLLALVRGAPDHTPAAIGLLMALRQGGQLATAWPATDRPAIPASIAQYWDEATLPADVAALMQSWREHNPDYRYVRFDDAAARAFLAERCMPDVLRAYRRAREPAMKADLFRLAWLFVEGGIYADADDRCLGPLAGLLPASAHFVACQEHFGTLGNNFLAVAPLHPVLGLGLAQAVLAVNRGDDDMPWLSTGPGLLTRAFAQVLASSALLPATLLAGTRVLLRHELEQVVATHCDLVYKHTSRHWLRAVFGQPGGAPATARAAGDAAPPADAKDAP